MFCDVCCEACKAQLSADNFKILKKCRSDFDTKIQEALYQCCSRDHMLRDQDRDRIIFSRPRPRPRSGVFRDAWFEIETSKNRDRDQDRDRQLFGLLKQI